MEYGIFVCLVLVKFTQGIKVYRFDDVESPYIYGDIPLEFGPRSFTYNIKSLRKHMFNDDPVILGFPKDIKDLPRSPPVLPGQTLLRPALGMLKSQISFPHVDEHPVYGNTNNIGLKTRDNEYVLYTDFRKGNNIIDNLLKSVFRSIKKIDTEELGRPYSEFLASVCFGAVEEKTKTLPKVLRRAEDGEDGKDGKDGKGGAGGEGGEGGQDGETGKDVECEGKSQNPEEQEDEDDGYERNPGNPFTVKQGRYLQNWPWKLDLDGDHININPYAPQWDTMGISGADLFFARKWWYFNQVLLVASRTFLISVYVVLVPVNKQ